MDDDREYTVVINHEEQYSIWFADREIPAGWTETGFKGSKKACLDHIEEVWTDIRPKSLRDWLADQQQPKADGDKPSS